MKIRKSDIKRWCAAFDSGKYKQSKYKLQDEDGHCCLGLGCVVFKTGKLNDTMGILFGGLPQEQSNVPSWLQDINDDFAEKTGISLVNCNDQLGLTFPEIATCLELVYIHNILD